VKYLKYMASFQFIKLQWLFERPLFPIFSYNYNVLGASIDLFRPVTALPNMNKIVPRRFTLSNETIYQNIVVTAGMANNHLGRNFFERQRREEQCGPTCVGISPDKCRTCTNTNFPKIYKPVIFSYCTCTVEIKSRVFSKIALFEVIFLS